MRMTSVVSGTTIVVLITTSLAWAASAERVLQRQLLITSNYTMG